MKLLCSILALGSLTQAVPIKDEIPTFKIDLSLHPLDRFTEVGKHFSKEINEILGHVEEKIGWMGVLVAKAVWSLDVFIPSLQPERYYEIKGIMAAAGVELWQGMALNYIYEYGAYCTSIVARQADGTVIHGRNLDFQATQFLRDMTYRAEFYDGDVHKYTTMMFAGHMGVFTGEKANGFSISEDDRFPTHAKSLYGLAENMILIFLGFDEISWAIRKSLNQCDSYSCAFNFLQDAPIISPGYIIIAGTEGNEGAIISRDRFAPAHVDQLSEDRWYVLQTNSDHWKGICKDRCAEGNKNMLKVGQANISLDTLRSEVLYQQPNYNHKTLYNA